MRTRGTLSSWNDDKGYGFVEPEGGGPDVFVHITAFRDRHRRPEVGQAITFYLGSDRRGRPRAENATRTDGQPRRRRSLISPTVPLAAVYLPALILAALANEAPWWLPGLVAGMSLLTFLIYAWDKSAARRGAWRRQESTLHCLALLGGWPGAAFAQHRLRHKSSKPSFRAMFWLTVILNCSLVGWLLFSEDGQELLWMSLRF